MLLFTHLSVETAAFSQSAMIMNIGRFVFTHRIPVGFKCLLYDLMAHKSNVKPPFGYVQILSHFKVFIGYVNPISYFVYCHNRCRLIIL